MGSDRSVFPRLFAALTVAALAVVVCLVQRHFTLVLSDPESFRIMTTHRCGRLLALAVAWAVVETVAACASLALRRHGRPPACLKEN